jgi:NAD(P)-dependent dehydrogenase (short-subunit alcohol dehydrogenase family)
MNAAPHPVAIITGAERGIGAGLVAAFRRGGYAVVATSRSIPASEYTSDDFAAITAVNLAGFFHITRSAIRPMLSQGAGHIVNISTSLVDHADSATPSALASLTKGGLVAVTRSLAIEYAARGVRVNAVSLGVIRTPMHDPGFLRGHGGASPNRPCGRDQRRRRRDPLSRTRVFRHRRDPAHRRRAERWTLTARPRNPTHTGARLYLTISRSRRRRGSAEAVDNTRGVRS